MNHPQAEPGQRAKDELRVRVARFGALRCARRALAAVVVRRNGALDRAARRQREALERLTRQLLDGAAPSEGVLQTHLAALDAGLDALEARVASAAAACALPQLRSALPSVAEVCHDEVRALLDVCARAAPRDPALVRRAEYLVTLLCSGPAGALRVQRVDPAALGPGLAALCDAAPPPPPSLGDAREVAARLARARERVGEADELDELLEEVRALKEQLGTALFAPALLREAVAYNLRVWNRREELLDRDRTSSLIEEVTLIASFSALQAPEPEPPAAPDEPSGPDTLRGLDALLGAALSDLAHPPGSPGHSGLSVHLDELGIGSADLRALSQPEPTETDALIRQLVATGLALAHVARDGDAEAFGLDPHALERAWVRRLDRRVRGRINQLIGAAELDEAQRLFESKQRFLYAALSKLIQERARQAPAAAPARKLSVQGARDLIGRALEFCSTDFSHVPVQVEGRGSLAALLSAVLALALGLQLFVGGGRHYAGFSARELAALSPHLESGYTAAEGGPFIGVLRDSWQKLGPDERRTRALEVAKTLGFMSIHEVRLYDTRQRLRVHAVGERLRVPR